MTFDYKKEYKEFYMPKGTPSIVRVPKMNYIAVRGSGNPNDADGEYKQSIGLLYGIAFTIKMSKIFRLCGAAIRGILVARRRVRNRLCAQGRIQVDFCYSLA